MMGLHYTRDCSPAPDSTSERSYFPHHVTSDTFSNIFSSKLWNILPQSNQYFEILTHNTLHLCVYGIKNWISHPHFNCGLWSLGTLIWKVHIKRFLHINILVILVIPNLHLILIQSWRWENTSWDWCCHYNWPCVMTKYIWLIGENNCWSVFNI